MTTTINDTTRRILARSDEGLHPTQIAGSLDLSLSTVYAALREHRPRRKRKPRVRTSAKRLQIFALADAGTGAAEIATMVECSRAYVYKALAER